MDKSENEAKPKGSELYAVVSEAMGSAKIAEPVSTYMVRSIREGLPIDEFYALCADGSQGHVWRC